MPTTPLRLDVLEDGDVRPRDWQPRRTRYKGPLRIVRLCVLGAFLPAALVAGPIYLRYRVFSEQLYPLAASDQRLIDRKVSTTWCQRQTVRVNATFNAYLLREAPKIEKETIPISMTRHLVLEDDMKEYWGFYLLRGSSVTVSTCVRWPGASLTIIRGHKHLHECAFIGDDSSEELEELLEVAEERGLLNGTAEFHLSLNKDSSPSNIPEMMKRARQEVRFHERSNAPRHPNETLPSSDSNAHNYGSHELDADAMRKILTHLFAKTLDTKKKQRENPHHHYEGVYKESANIDKPPTGGTGDWNPFLVSGDDSGKRIVPIDAADTSAKCQCDQGEEASPKLVDNEDNDQITTETERSRDAVVDSITNEETANVTRDRPKRQTIELGSPLLDAFTRENEGDEDVAIEEEDFIPDGIAQDRGTVNETTLNDRSNSEFWSSFSSSEERLLECKGLVLNLPLTPHIHCSPRYEGEHLIASVANTVTYRVPTDGYYFFVFNSENEIQPNYVRIQFDLVKTVYDTSDPVYSCKNSTEECSLPFNFFSHEMTVLELPVNGNDSQWNEEYVVVSICEPRTSIYLICTITVPLLILFFAFH